MLAALLLEYLRYADGRAYHAPAQQSGNMALFVTMFLICCIEVIVVKIVTEEERLEREAAAEAESRALGGAYTDFG